MSDTALQCDPGLGRPPLSLDLGGSEVLTDARLAAICRENDSYRIERSSLGDLVVREPTGGETGRCNATLLVRLGSWAERDDTGCVFDSSTGFRLPSGAVRSPDLAWVRRERWESLSAGEREGFPPLAPDFVVELASPADWRPYLAEKMTEWLEAGVRLAWLVDPAARRVTIRRPGRDPEIRAIDEPLSGDRELPGLVLRLSDVL